MLLFFDDIAVFSSPEHRSRPLAIDPHLCAPLAERGLVQFVNPRAVTTPQTDVIIRATLHRAAIESADHWLAAAAAGDWDIEVPRLKGRVPGPVLTKTGEPFASGDPGSLELFKFLAQDGWLLPDESTDDDWFGTPGIASVANSILAQAVRAMARGQGWSIEPIATRRDEARVFRAILDGAIENVSASDVVMSDLSAVTVNLCDVGLDDILEFRSRHRNELRAYVLALQALWRRLRRRMTLPIAKPASWIRPMGFSNFRGGAGPSPAQRSALASPEPRGASGPAISSVP